MADIKEFVKKNIIGTQYEWESHFENITSLCDKHLKGFRPENLLDVGCATGERTKRIAKHLHVNLNQTYGLDSDEKRVVECRKTFQAELVDLEVDAIPYESDTFDLVICNQVLEHLKNATKVVDEIIRVTNKNGYIILGIPNLAHLINRIYLLLGIQPMCIAIGSSHIRGFTHKGFMQMLKAIEPVRFIDCTGALMYPFPYHLAKHLSKLFVGLSSHTCYLLQIRS